MGKILDVLNVPANVKKYIAIKKMKKHTEINKNWKLVLIIDILIGLAFAAEFYYIYFISKVNSLKYVGILSVVLFGVFCIGRMTYYVLGYEKKYKGIKMLSLVGDPGIPNRIWNIDGKICLLIGKNTRDNEVDIDLSDTEYASLISRQHAVLNFAEGSWYIEDIGSSNGVGIQNMGQNTKFMIEQGNPYKLKSGDIIYIANAKMIAR